MSFHPTEEIYTHAKVARQCLIDKISYDNFKRNPDYTKILEHCVPRCAEKMLDKLLSNDNLLPNDKERLWNGIRENDRIGNPVKHDFRLIFEKYGYDFWKDEEYIFSPSTIQYVYQAFHIIQKINKKGMRIVEIGGGYGGLCYILQTLCYFYDISISDYTIIDLPDISKHQKKYLDDVLSRSYNMTNQPNIKFVSNTEVDSTQQYDLCISIFSLGEFARSIIDSYYRDVLKKSEHTYLWWNLSPIPEYLKNFHFEKSGFDIAGQDLIMWN